MEAGARIKFNPRMKRPTLTGNKHDHHAFDEDQVIHASIEDT
jgi:hypothetical protein